MVTVTFYTNRRCRGQNMSTSCTWHACQWLMHQMKYLDEIRLETFSSRASSAATRRSAFSHSSPDDGTRVTAKCMLPHGIVEDVLKVKADELVRAFGLPSAFGIQSGTVGWNINVANLLAGVFAATVRT